MATSNIGIRKEIAEAGLNLWQVADAMGMQDSNFSRLLRKELSEVNIQRVRSAIEKAKEVYIK